MDYHYIALEWDAQNDVLEGRYASKRRYELEHFLRRELEEKTTLSHLVCFRIRGTKSISLDPYEMLKVDQGEL